MSAFSLILLVRPVLPLMYPNFLFFVFKKKKFFSMGKYENRIYVLLLW